MRSTQDLQASGACPRFDRIGAVVPEWYRPARHSRTICRRSGTSGTRQGRIRPSATRLEARRSQVAQWRRSMALRRHSDRTNAARRSTTVVPAMCSSDASSLSADTYGPGATDASGRWRAGAPGSSPGLAIAEDAAAPSAPEDASRVAIDFVEQREDVRRRWDEVVRVSAQTAAALGDAKAARDAVATLSLDDLASSKTGISRRTTETVEQSGRR